MKCKNCIYCDIKKCDYVKRVVKDKEIGKLNKKHNCPDFEQKK